MKPWKLLKIVDQSCCLCQCSLSPMIHHSWIFFLMIDYKNASFCWVSHCWLHWFFFYHVMVLVFLCKDHCCHHDAIIMFIVHWSSSWSCCAYCNCNSPSHLLVFCFCFGPFEIANRGVLWNDHCYHLGMILMFTTNWSLSWWCCAHCNYNNPSQLFWSLKVTNSLLELVCCVLCFM